jgi:hypothetical protein
MIVGPLGPALSKGFDFRMVANAAHGGSTEVRQLVSRWQIEEGKAVARDVARADGKNSIAMSGGVDIASERFQNLVVAGVDAGGCVLVRQEMDGPFESPEVKKPSFIESAAGPLINIFKGTVKVPHRGEVRGLLQRFCCRAGEVKGKVLCDQHPT